MTEQREINDHTLTEQINEFINVVSGFDMKGFTFASPDQSTTLCAVKKFITDK